MTTMRCFRFLWHQLPEPMFNSALGQLRESIWGAQGSRKEMQNGLESQNGRDMDQENCPGIKRSHQVFRLSLQICGLAVLERHTSFSSTAPSWKIKTLCSLLLRLYGNPWARNCTRYKKRGKKTQAGCKLFESFMRRGIFPVIFFSFLKFVSK